MPVRLQPCQTIAALALSVNGVGKSITSRLPPAWRLSMPGVWWCWWMIR